MKYEFENENILAPETKSGYQICKSNESDRVLQIRCPHCQILGSFSALEPSLQYYKREKAGAKSRLIRLIASTRVCPNPPCHGIIFTISSNMSVYLVLPSETLDFQVDNIPPPLVKTLKEAIICHANGAFRASSMMVRRLLEELCHECSAEGKSLHDRLQSLRTQIILPEDLFDAMDELKALGNDAAHIEAKAYKMIDEEEAQISIELAKEILKARYQHKSLVDRLRAHRSEPEV